MKSAKSVKVVYFEVDLSAPLRSVSGDGDDDDDDDDDDGSR